MPALHVCHPYGVPRSVARVNPPRELRLLQDSDVNKPFLQGAELRLQSLRPP